MASFSRLRGARLRTARFLFDFGVDPDQVEFWSDSIVFFDEDLGGPVFANNPGNLTLSAYRRFVASSAL